MIEIKQSTLVRVPVYLTQTNGNPKTLVTENQVAVTVLKSDGTTQNLTIDNTNWVEVTAGTFASQGVYWLRIPASATNIPGLLVYLVSAAGAKPYRGAVKVVGAEEADTKAVVDAIRADYTTQLATDLGALNTDLVNLQAQVQDLHDIQFGKWQIHVSGADANKLVLYKPDGTTVIAKFDLQNANGDPTYINPFRRVPE